MTQVRQEPVIRAVHGDRAGFITRMAALIIDGVLVIGTWVVILATIAITRFMVRPRLGIRIPHLPSWATVVCVGLLAISIPAVLWATTGRSIGDVVMGLRVVRSSGAKIGFARALIRAVLCVIFPIGLVVVAFDRRNRSLQDLIVRTAVVYDWGQAGRPPA